MRATIFFVALALPVSVGSSAESGDKVKPIPDDYTLAYHQDFEGESPLGDFVFTDPAAWRLSEEDGNHSLELYQASDYKPPHRSPRNLALVAGKWFKSFVFEAQVKYTGRKYNHADQCLFFGFQDPAHYYYAHIGKTQDPHAHQIFVVKKKPRTAITDRSRTDGFPWQPGRWEKVRLVRDAERGRIAVYIRNMHEPVLVAEDDNFQRGWLGFGSFDDRGHVDNIHVWAPADEVQEKAIDYFESQ